MNWPLFPHQREAAQKNPDRKYLGFWMGMRTGKTRSLITRLYQKNLWPALIIAPLSTLAGWQNEFRELGFPENFFKTVRPRTGRKTSTARNQLLCPDARVFGVNFEAAEELDALNIRSTWTPYQNVDLIRSLGGSLKKHPRAPEFLQLPNWRAVVVDESYRIANAGAGITQYMLKSPQPGTQHRFCLSGAPAPESPRNFAAQYLFMCGEYFGCRTAEEYEERYWEWCPRKYAWAVRDPVHLKLIREFIQDNGYLATMDTLGLGRDKFLSLREVPANQAQEKLFTWVRLATVYNHPKTGELTEMEPMVRVIFEQKISAGVHPLTNEMISDEKIIDILTYYKENPQPMLVLSRFKAPIHRLQALAKAAGIRCGVITGDTPENERERVRWAFQGGLLDIVVAQVRTVKMGMDFSRLGVLWYMSNSFSLDDRQQSEERGNHTKLKTPYLVFDQHTIGSADRRIRKILTEKGMDASFYLREINQEIINHAKLYTPNTYANQPSFGPSYGSY